MNPVNAKAAKLMESLHDYILESKYPKNASDLLMTRIVFCFLLKIAVFLTLINSQIT